MKFEDLTDKEIDALWDEYEKDDPYQEIPWSYIVSQAQRDKTLQDMIELLKKNNIIAIKREKPLDELGLLLSMECWQELKEMVK